MLRFTVLTIAALSATATPAYAQAGAPRPHLIAVSADAPFAHANSGITLPATLIDLPRRQVQEVEAPPGFARRSARCACPSRRAGKG